MSFSSKTLLVFTLGQIPVIRQSGILAFGQLCTDTDGDDRFHLRPRMQRNPHTRQSVRVRKTNQKW